MELVPPPERVVLPPGVNLVQCFVCTAMFYTQEEMEKHLRLHRKSDILRAVSEHRVHHRPAAVNLVRAPDSAPAGFKQESSSAAAGSHHHHHHHHHQAGSHHHAGAHHQSASHHSHHQASSHQAGSHHHHHPLHPPLHWLEVQSAPEPPPPPPPPPLPPPAAHEAVHYILPDIHSVSSLHGWHVVGGGAADVPPPPPDYTDLDAGPSGAARPGSPRCQFSPPASAAEPPEQQSQEPDLPAAELLCTEESLHSSCPSPGEPARPPPDYQPHDFSVYSSEVAGYPPPSYAGSPPPRSAPAACEPEPLAAAERDTPQAEPDFVSFKCIHCSREFGSAEEIHLHVSAVSQASHVCQVCHKVCISAWHLHEHQAARHTSPRPFRCGVCACEFRTAQLHRQHILLHIREHIGTELPAPPEPEALPAPAAPAAALPAAPAPPALPDADRKPAAPERKPVSCATCGARFSLTAALQRHIQQQHRQKRRPTRRICSCDHCGRIFYSYRQLRWHAEIHGKKPHTCATCGLRFLHESWLTRHVRSQHNPHFLGANSGDTRTCPVCNKVYMRSSLSKHIRMMHQDVKPYQCQRCGRRFAANCNLQTHILSHLPYRDRPFKCTVCRKAYTTERDLRVHLAVHAGKRFPCKICGREFSRASSMNTHLREHDGEKKHMCGVCGKSFARKAYLRSHLRVHTGERPHVCSVCERSFASRSNYNAHVKSHNRREPVNAEL